MSRYFIDISQRVPRTIFPGVEIRTAAGARMMLSYVEIQARAVVEAHSHPHEQGGIVLAGRARFYIGDEERVLGPGDMYCIPGGVTHKVVALDEGCTALDVFCPVREDYL